MVRQSCTMVLVVVGLTATATGMLPAFTPGLGQAQRSPGDLARSSAMTSSLAAPDVDFEEMPQATSAPPLFVLAAASVLGLVLGLASVPQSALASAQAGQGLDAPIRAGTITQRQRDLLNVSQIDKIVKEVKVDLEKRANQTDKTDRLKVETAKLQALAEGAKIPA